MARIVTKFKDGTTEIRDFAYADRPEYRVPIIPEPRCVTTSLADDTVNPDVRIEFRSFRRVGVHVKTRTPVFEEW